MNLSDYDYKLPEELIAKYPPKTRGQSRLLVLSRKTGEIINDQYYNIDQYLNPGDLIVLNNTKVLKARIKTWSNDNKLKEILILERHHKNEDWFRHQVLYKGKLRENEILRTIKNDQITIEKIIEPGIAIVKSKLNLLELSNSLGEVPLPPYLKRTATKEDIKRYQTIWAKEVGSVAAPTASLNMTKALLQKLTRRGVKISYSTLHVGIGTFLPIRVNDLNKHKMYKEYFEIPKQTVIDIKMAKQNSKKVVAIGTTITRALEYSHKKIMNDKAQSISGEADIFIYPGYNFKVIDGLLTNFHAPKSTVLMLASAFGGWDNLFLAYSQAINKKYRFLSYGDSMLII